MVRGRHAIMSRSASSTGYCKASNAVVRAGTRERPTPKPERMGHNLRASTSQSTICERSLKMRDTSAKWKEFAGMSWGLEVVEGM